MKKVLFTWIQEFWGFRNYELFRLVFRILNRFSISTGCAWKIPLNPPLQKGEVIGIPELVLLLSYNTELENPVNLGFLRDRQV